MSPLVCYCDAPLYSVYAIPCPAICIYFRTIVMHFLCFLPPFVIINMNKFRISVCNKRPPHTPRIFLFVNYVSEKNTHNPPG